MSDDGLVFGGKPCKRSAGASKQRPAKAVGNTAVADRKPTVKPARVSSEKPASSPKPAARKPAASKPAAPKPAAPKPAAPKPAAPKPPASKPTAAKPAPPRPAPQPAAAKPVVKPPRRVPAPMPALAKTPSAPPMAALESGPLVKKKKSGCKKEKAEKKSKKKKTAAAVPTAQPRDTKAEEVQSSSLSAWWRELALAAIVILYVGVYLVVHPARAGALQGTGVIEFEGRGAMLYANGEPFSIKGVNWFGSEAFNGPPGGLDEHTIGWYCDFLRRNDFNAIRLLFNHEHVIKNDIVDAPAGAELLFQTRYLEMFAVLARVAAERGILVMMACHRINKDAWPGAGLWYDTSLGFPESRVLQSWTKVAAALCGQWNVVAVDLQNEPHASSWGWNLATDWNQAAERIGNHVLELCPRWLIMVEGVGYTPGAPGADDPGAGFWWGENLVGAKVAPVHLRDDSKLVYSPHVYGPSVYMQHYFEDFNFPFNMPAVWEQHFAFSEELDTPIVIGEIGGDYMGRDQQWQDWAIPYIKKKGIGIFYFALNPDSEDTGGLVPKDWSEPAEGSAEYEKLQALAELPSTKVFEICPECRPPPPSSAPAAGPAASVKPTGAPVSTDAILAVLTAIVFAVWALLSRYKKPRPAATVPTVEDDLLDDGSEPSASPRPAIAHTPTVTPAGDRPHADRRTATHKQEATPQAEPQPQPAPAPVLAAPPKAAHGVAPLLRPPPPAAAPPGGSDGLQCGMRVEVNGLGGVKKYNGMSATLVSCLPSPSGDRWNVTCDDGTNLNLKPANLRPV